MKKGENPCYLPHVYPQALILTETQLFFLGTCPVRQTEAIQRGKKNTKKKYFAASRLATIMATRWTGNNFFFKGGLTDRQIARQAERDRHAERLHTMYRGYPMYIL